MARKDTIQALIRRGLSPEHAALMADAGFKAKKLRKVSLDDIILLAEGLKDPKLLEDGISDEEYFDRWEENFRPNYITFEANEEKICPDCLNVFNFHERFTWNIVSKREGSVVGGWIESRKPKKVAPSIIKLDVECPQCGRVWETRVHCVQVTEDD